MRKKSKSEISFPKFQTLEKFVYPKAQSFCAYQERCIKEVKDKLKRLDVNPSQIIPIISQLQKEDFINEERYARSYAIGKLRNNKWGKIKIRYELIKKQIPQAIINSSLSEIDEDEYYTILKNIISRKSKEIKAHNKEQIKVKVIKYAVSKGFEPELIFEILKSY